MELTPPRVLSINSSTRDDVWHDVKSPRAYEWWYFDAISDDGRDAMIVVFLDNFIFSPRHADPSFAGRGEEMVKIRTFEVKDRFPAVSFTYCRDGEVVYRAMNEFSQEDLGVVKGGLGCRFGESGFSFETAQYGSGYIVSVVAALGDGRRLAAELEWLSIESDLKPSTDENHQTIAWNIVAPRSDVSGKIEVAEENGDTIETIQFRGTGCHDHVIDDHWLPETETRFHRGGAHFTDVTAMFGRFEEPGEDIVESQLILVRDDKMDVMNAWCEEQDMVRDRHGIRHSSSLTFTSPEGVRLAVECSQVLDSSFFYLRRRNNIKLTFEDGTIRTAEGLSELVAPQFQRHRWLDWLANLRRTSKDF